MSPCISRRVEEGVTGAGFGGRCKVGLVWLVLYVHMGNDRQIPVDS